MSLFGNVSRSSKSAAKKVSSTTKKVVKGINEKKKNAEHKFSINYIDKYISKNRKNLNNSEASNLKKSIEILRKKGKI